MCGRKDILLIAGKGHETYQEIKGAVIPFDDRETVREIEVPRYVEAPEPEFAVGPKAPLFEDVSDDDLLGYGVPPEWLAALHGFGWLRDLRALGGGS